jgi:hypothetical protein
MSNAEIARLHGHEVAIVGRMVFMGIDVVFADRMLGREVVEISRWTRRQLMAWLGY